MRGSANSCVKFSGADKNLLMSPFAMWQKQMAASSSKAWKWSQQSSEGDEMLPLVKYSAHGRASFFTGDQHSFGPSYGGDGGRGS
jgi:hypothetical protein